MLEFLEQLKNTDHLTALHVVVLLAAGFGVGFVNTIAGSGTIVSYSVFMFFGVPANFANGTIRLGVVMQTLAASYHFYKKQLLNLRTGLRYALPIAVGSVVGAQIAVEINQLFFEKIIAAVILFMVVLMLYNPERWIQSGGKACRKINGGTCLFISRLVFMAVLYTLELGCFCWPLLCCCRAII